MIEVVRSGRVEASPERVWHVVSRADRAAEWLAFTDRVEVTSGAGCGERRTQYGRWGERHSEIDVEVVEYRRPKVVAWRHVAERLDGRPAPRFAAGTEFRVELEPDGAGTLVRLRSCQEPASALKGLLIKAFGRRQVARGMEKSLARLTSVFAQPA
ncbi:SRPBCC family protein [Saccharothrix variisporea]|uniref:Carbon monoxide dehydrogenase subunit G n=1 Tax=Saccharothrix variisporea TaxID=543527 RepID=A0A495XIK9_9PSEU|nr:SRPBCC domain-containing protein [Saccharothrix variisporea]RKT73599.1 carbon monoxide dehydrogenase subunit G [Saccharothrix variisporea]